VIAAINGVALGGGLELALAADLRLANPASRFGHPEISLANLPGWGGTQRLPRLIGRGRALELILTGDSISAERAYNMGLVNQLSSDCLAAAVSLAKQFATRSPVAIAGAKRAVHVGLEAGMTAGLLAEANAVAACCETEEQRRAIKSFLLRRS
jgi:enoyl-CoA hydratase/carnithine racemase